MDALPSSRDKAIHIVEKTMLVDQLIMIMYNSPSADVYRHFKMVNAHIKKGETRFAPWIVFAIK